MEKVKEMFVVGNKYKVFSINALAMTSASELKIHENSERGVIYTEGRKRKKYRLNLDSLTDMAIFEGWDQPVKADSEDGSMIHGNACLNFIGTPEEVRNWINEKQLNPNLNKGKIICRETADGTEKQVFPENYTPGEHAVIDKILKKNEE